MIKQITMGAAERAIIISDAEIILVEIIRWLGKSNTHTHEFLFKSLLRKPWSCTLIFYSWSIFVGYEFSIYALERAWELLWWSAHQIDVCQRIMIISENYSPRERWETEFTEWPMSWWVLFLFCSSLNGMNALGIEFTVKSWSWCADDCTLKCVGCPFATQLFIFENELFSPQWDVFSEDS